MLTAMFQAFYYFIISLLHLLATFKYIFDANIYSDAELFYL